MSEAGLDRFLVAVELRMREEIARTPAAEPARALLDAGGKRLRVRLVWWSANATAPGPVDPDHEALVRAAAAVEFAHLGSLVHDDIADSSDSRRGVPTVHRSHGIDAAVDAGTALAHLASEMVATLGRAARHAVRRAILATCRGQIRELAVPFQLLSPRSRLTIMQEKTGAFLELASALGAIVVDAPLSHRAAIQRFARRFGVAFQIADDVLDLAGDPRELGRANGADLREGVATLPLLLATNDAGALSAALARVQNDPTCEAIGACAELVERGGGIRAATEVAHWWLDRAEHELRLLPTSVAVDQLRCISRATVARGVRMGTPTFVGTPAASLAAFEARTSWIDALRHARQHNAGTLDARLARTLNWFHPGVSGLISAIAQEPEIARSRASAYHQVVDRTSWSDESLVAADALTLAHAIATHAMSVDPPRVLALVDALYCTFIGELCRAANPDEHQQLTMRARRLRCSHVPPKTFAPPATRTVPCAGVSLSA